MPRPTIKFAAFDLSNVANKRRLMSQIGALDGIYSVTLEPRRPTRSLRQNAAWWGMIVTPLYEYLHEHDIDVTCAEDVHDMLKDHFLKIPVFDRDTGELIGNRVQSTAKLSTEEFADLFDRARHWMEEKFGIVVPDPDPCYSAVRQ